MRSAVAFVALLSATIGFAGCGGSGTTTVTISSHRVESAIRREHPDAKDVHCEDLRIVRDANELANVPEPGCSWQEHGKERVQGP